MMRVIETIQSEGNEPVDMPYYTGDSEIAVVAALADIMRHVAWQRENKGNLRPEARFWVRGVRVEFNADPLKDY